MQVVSGVTGPMLSLARRNLPDLSATARRRLKWFDWHAAHALEAIITIDGDQRIVTFNPAAERMFRCPAAEAVGRPLDALIPERFRAPHDGHVRTFASSGARVRAMSARLPVRGLRADGEEFPLEASLVRFTTAGQTRFGAIPPGYYGAVPGRGGTARERGTVPGHL
jgi:PAS domain S-box-containing protein